MKIAIPVKLTSLAVLLLLPFTFLVAQPVSKDAYDCPDFLIPRKDKATRLFGYVDITGTYIIPPTYVQAGYFQGKNARVQVGKRFGVINCEGRLVVPADYEVIDDFVNGFGWVQKGGKWGLMRSDGKMEVQTIFDSVNAVSRRSSLTWVYKDSLWGIFDNDAHKMVIDPAYKMYRNVTDSIVIGRYDRYFDIVDLKRRLAVVDSATEVVRLSPFVLGYKKRHWGLVDIHGRGLLAPEADTLLADNNCIVAYQNTRPLLFSHFGKPVKITLPVDSLILTNTPLVRYRTKTGQGLIDLSGRKVFVNEYDQVIGPLGKFALLKKGSWYVFRQGSKSVGTARYDSVHVLNRGANFALYSQGTASVYASSSGQIIMPGVLSSIASDTGILVRCQFRPKGEGLLNLKTGTIINPNKDVLFATPSAPLFTFSGNGKKGLVNYTSGKMITEAEFDQVQTLSFQGRPAFAATKGEDVVLRDANNRPIIQKEIRNAQLPIIPFNNSGFFFKRKSEYGGIALNGEEVVKPAYDTVLVPKENNPQVFLGRNRSGWFLVGADGKRIVGDIKDAQFLGFALWAGLQNGTNRVIDYTGADKKSPPFDSIMAFSENLAAYKTNGRWGFMNRQLSPSLAPAYESVTPFYKGKSVVRVGGLYGLIDQHGKYLLHPKYAHFLIENGQYRLF